MAFSSAWMKNAEPTKPIEQPKKKFTLTPEQEEEMNRDYEAALEKVRRDKEHNEYEWIPTPEQEGEIKKLEEQAVADGKVFRVELNLDDFSDRTKSPFTHGNKYNYRINVNHPAILPHYERYKNYLHENIINDHQRFMFEMHIQRELDRLHLTEYDFKTTEKKSNKKDYFFNR